MPNPFFGVPGTGELGTAATILAGQLLRPFPQFNNVTKLQVTEGGKRQYHAMFVKLDKRTTGVWGGSFNYTWSRMKDNQWGQTSTYGASSGTPQNYYDLDAEYGISNFDSPHRIILAPIVKFPNSSSDSAVARWLLNGWNASAVVELVSGSPLNATYSQGTSDANLGLFGGRQRPNLTGDPNTDGSDTDRVIYEGNEGARYFDSGAFSSPGVGAYGDAPRTIDDARYQFRRNFDLVLAKDTTLFSSHVAQVRFEILNLTNTPKFRGIDSNSVDTTTFGQITQQAGFMRIWQLSFRYTF